MDKTIIVDALEFVKKLLKMTAAVTIIFIP